jgi:hypothetical protein
MRLNILLATQNPTNRHEQSAYAKLLGLASKQDSEEVEWRELKLDNIACE